MKNFKSKIKYYYEKMLPIIRKPVISVLPGHLSFFLLLSAIPIILIFSLFASWFSLSYDEIANFIKLSLPSYTSKLILPLIHGKAFDFSVIILILSAIYLASRGTKAIIMAANNIYGGEEDNIVDIIKAYIITILLIILFLFMIIILLLGGKILELINSLPGININFFNSIDFIRWPISLFIIFFALKLIYTLTPNKKISSKTVNRGSLFTTVLWVITTYIYSFYVTHYSSYNTYYGSASNLIILMLWVYLISRIFVYGMIINYIDDNTKNNE